MPGIYHAQIDKSTSMQSKAMQATFLLEERKLINAVAYYWQKDLDLCDNKLLKVQPLTEMKVHVKRGIINLGY